LVPTKASLCKSMPGLPDASAASPAVSGRVLPSSNTCMGGLVPSAKVAIFCTMPSS
jgi:hypothetical protein